MGRADEPRMLRTTGPSRQTQMDLRARGGFIPHFFVGHKVLYRKDAVLSWIQEQESKAAWGADGCP
jgi:hypothetical protein